MATLRDVANHVRGSGHTIVALGITNQRETTVAFDRETGHLEHRALVWQDRRTAPYCDQLVELGHADLVRRTTGLVLDAYFSATKMRWLLEHGALDAAVSPSLCTVDTWLLWWLSGADDGGVFVTEPSNASRTMLMDLDTLEWSSDMTSLFDVPTSMLADIRPSTTNFATVSGAIVPELAGVPVTGVLGDQQAALFGQACFSPGLVKATYGTGAFVLANAGTQFAGGLGWSDHERRVGPRRLRAGDVLRGRVRVRRWRGGAVVARRTRLHRECARPRAARVSVTSSEGVAFVPAFTGLGSPFWRGEARGSITGLSQRSNRAHIARALVEALAFQVRAMTNAFESAGIALRELRADGGAAAMDSLMQLQATASRLSVARSRSLEATARGAATIAGLEIGYWHSLEQLAELWELDRSFAPEDPSFLDASYAAWLRACERA